MSRSTRFPKSKTNSKSNTWWMAERYRSQRRISREKLRRYMDPESIVFKCIDEFANFWYSPKDDYIIDMENIKYRRK